MSDCEAGVVLSLEEAIRDKYCWDDHQQQKQLQQTTKPINEIALSYRPGACPLKRLSHVVLDRKGVTSVRDVKDLEELCPALKELHLPFNSITDSKDMMDMLSALASLKVLDLSYNPLDSTTFRNHGCSLLHLSTLVLNGTCISWPALEICLARLDQLLEMHLSVNKYKRIDFTESFQQVTLQQLHLNDNQIGEWMELAKLSRAFPNLRSLIACGNPIQEIPELSADLFPCLCVLNLNECCLSTWQSLEHLKTLHKLEELSVMKVPLGKELKEKVRRQAFISHLPKILKLNKSTISETERESAERWLIREMAKKPDPSANCKDLIAKHGELKPLADIDLNPTVTVKLKFDFVGQERVEECDVDVDQTVWTLKKWVAETLLGMPVNTFRLYNHERKSWELMSQNKKHLYTYRFAPGTKIYIEMK